MKEKILILFIPFIFLLYGIFTIGDYGINWDEPYHFRRGQAFLQYYLTGKKTYEGIPKYPALKGGPDSPDFRDSLKHFVEVQNNPSLSDPNFRRSYYQDDDWDGTYHIDIEDPHGHPALGGILASLFNRIFYQKLGVLGDLESYHLFEITTASILVLAVAIFMWREFGIVESVVSTLALSTYPLFLGESHFNIKDPIEATFYTLTLMFFYKTVTKRSSLWLILTSVAFALALSVKFNIVFIFFPCLVWGLLYIYKNRNTFRINKKFILAAISSPIIIAGLFILSFPTLWKNPIWGVGRVVSYYLDAGYGLSQPSQYYLWGFINTYPLTWIIYTTPIITLLLFFAFFFFSKEIFKKKVFPLLLLFTFLTIIGRISFFGAVSYGGVRIIMEFVPIMAMMAGISAGQLAQKVKKIPLTILLIVILASFTPIIIKLAALHPNENVYFNSLAGGLSGAEAKNINSWGNSYGNAYFPALLWLNKNAETNAKLTLPVGSATNIPRFKLRSDISFSSDLWSGPKHEGEYALELTYDYEPAKWYSLSYLNSAMKPVYEVKVDGVAIAKVWKNSPEFVLPEFKNQKTINVQTTTAKDRSYIEVKLPEEAKIMQADIPEPQIQCEPITTGYAETSLNGTDWTRGPEDIARNQINHSKLRGLESKFTFYFVTQPAKYIRFYPQNPDACILDGKEAIVRFL